ncbi:MAG: hypothetical protein QOH25_4114 [Acidobacteriota bacterium]|nr:hypothetical protein [Acidobacteriota bacterium]
MKKLTLFLLFSLCAATTAQAIPLPITNVSAPPINCVFDASCTVVVNDTTAPINLPGSGSGFFQSRTFRGLPGSAAAGKYAYLYRVDLRNAVGILSLGCVNSVTINFGPVVSTLDFNGDGATGEQVFVVTGGGIGSVGIASADRVGNNITFTFSSPVCAGSSPGRGQSSFFWGLVSVAPPRFVAASITHTLGPALSVQGRAPNYLFRGGRRRG